MSIFDKITDSIKGLEQVQSDWNQHDETQKDYIKNRPFYSENKVEPVVLLSKTEFDLSANIHNTVMDIDPDCNVCNTIVFAQDLEYVVYWNDTPYKCKPMDYYLLGNYSIYHPDHLDTGEPFIIDTAGSNWTIARKEAVEETVTLSIEQLRPYEDIVKIPEKYLPDSIGEEFSAIKENVSNVHASLDEISSKVDEVRGIAERQADWNQNDCDAVDFVKNRTHYTECVKGDGLCKFGIDVRSSETVCTLNNKAGYALKYLLDDCYIECGGLRYEIVPVGVNDNGEMEFTAYISHVDFTVSLRMDKNLDKLYASHNKAANKGIVISIYHPTCELAYHQLDERFIPDSIARVENVVVKPATAKVGQTLLVKAVDEKGNPTEWEAVDYMVVPSSVEGSTKKFKISVDDDGILSAVEIV